MVTIENFLDNLSDTREIDILSRQLLSNILYYAKRQSYSHADAVDLANNIINRADGITREMLDDIAFTNNDIITMFPEWALEAISDIGEFDDIESRRARAGFTVFCIENQIDIDSYTCENILKALYSNYFHTPYDITFDIFKNFMTKDLKPMD